MDKEWKRTIVGVFDVVCGISAFFPGSLMTLSLWEALFLLSLNIPLLLILAFFAVMGVISILGGIYALHGGPMWLAITGSIAASIALPILGIPATVMVLFSKETSLLTRIISLIFLVPVWLVYLGFLFLILVGYI